MIPEFKANKGTFKKYWIKETTPQQAAALVIGLHPETMAKAEKLHSEFGRRTFTDDEISFWRSFQGVASEIDFNMADGLLATYSKLIGLWRSNKETFIRDIYKRALRISPDFCDYLLSIGEMPTDPKLEIYENHDQYKNEIAKTKLTDITSEITAVAVLLDLSPSFFQRRYKLQAVRKNIQQWDKAAADDRFFVREYDKFISQEYEKNPFEVMSYIYEETKKRNLWKGNFKNYVQELRDAGGIFKPSITAALQKCGVPLVYSPNGWAFKFYKDWCDNRGAWTLKEAACLYLGENPHGGRSFFSVGNFTPYKSGRALISHDRIENFDDKGDPIPMAVGRYQYETSLEAFVRRHIAIDNLKTVQDEKLGDSLYFHPRNIVTFFRDYLPATFKPTALFAAVGLDQESRTSQDARTLTHSGHAGRPTARHLIEQEFKRRQGTGEVGETLSEEVKILFEWFQTKYPELPAGKTKTIENNIRDEFKKYKQKAKTAA